MKTCKKCAKIKPLEDFYKCPRGVFGRASCCIPCHNENSVQWRKNNRLKSNEGQKRWRRENRLKVKLWRREGRLRKEYGMSEKDYQARLKKQLGVCAICKTAPGKQRLCVDHCHATGQVRGLLCDSCNNGLGRFKDSPKSLAEAIKYLQQ